MLVIRSRSGFQGPSGRFEWPSGLFESVGLAASSPETPGWNRIRAGVNEGIATQDAQ